ncbi:MAG: lipoyl(octanoyl) transferase LipB [Desulfobacteraceae bacterium]|nr:lipoyl(octanoyl) transferase LipB [Desulfobacteraceae bacterium]
MTEKCSSFQGRECVRWLDLPLMDYSAALTLQHKVVGAMIEKRLKHSVILALEHPSVYTLGRRGGRENLMVSEAFLNQKNIRIMQVERGGNITYHGPGQLVVYPIVNLKQTRLKVVDFVAGLEEVMARTAGDWGIDAAGDTTNRGVWVGSRKLGSIGITVRRGISFHGLAFNVDLDLEPFSWMNPCGLSGIAITSLKNELGREISMVRVKRHLHRHLVRVFDFNTKLMELHELKAAIHAPQPSE